MSHYYKSHIVKIRKQFWKITVKMVSRTYTYYLENSSRKSQTKKSGTNLSWLRWTKLWSVEQRIYSRKSRRMPTRARVTDSRILVSHFESQLRTRKMTKKIKKLFLTKFWEKRCYLMILSKGYRRICIKLKRDHISGVI